MMTADPRQTGRDPSPTGTPDRNSSLVPPANEGVLHNEYDGEAERDGIPANGTEPVGPRGPDDLGA